MRHQSPMEAYGKPTHEPMDFQLALCPECKTPLEFWTDALGRVRERCPSCRGSFKRPRVLKPQVSQTALTNARDAQLLPRVAPGQLRCQRCAKGVSDNALRFCETCRAIPPRDRVARSTRRPWSDDARARLSASLKARRQRGSYFKPRQCRCGVMYDPSSPRQIWCSPDCPARRAA